jgi:hypothetical protein
MFLGIVPHRLIRNENDLRRAIQKNIRTVAAFPSVVGGNENLRSLEICPDCRVFQQLQPPGAFDVSGDNYPNAIVKEKGNKAQIIRIGELRVWVAIGTEDDTGEVRRRGDKGCVIVADVNRGTDAVAEGPSLNLDAAQDVGRNRRVPMKHPNRKTGTDVVQIADVIVVEVRNDESFDRGTTHRRKVERRSKRIIVAAIEEHDVVVVRREESAEAVAHVEDLKSHTSFPC